MLGVAGVFLRRPHPGAPPASATPSISLASPAAGTQSSPQTTILILGLSGVSDDTARLESIWFASFRLPNTEVYLHGVPLDARRASSGRALSEVFSWSPKKGASAAFLEDLAIVAPL